MKKTIVMRPGKRVNSYPISSAVIAEGKFVFVAGQGPLDPAAGCFVRGTIGEQTTLTLRCIEQIVNEAGASMEDVVSCRVFLQQLTEKTMGEMNEAYQKFFPENPPARTTVGCQLLNIDVEIDCIVRL